MRESAHENYLKRVLVMNRALKNEKKND